MTDLTVSFEIHFPGGKTKKVTIQLPDEASLEDTFDALKDMDPLLEGIRPAFLYEGKQVPLDKSLGEIGIVQDSTVVLCAEQELSQVQPAPIPEPKEDEIPSFLSGLVHAKPIVTEPGPEPEPEPVIDPNSLTLFLVHLDGRTEQVTVNKKSKVSTLKEFINVLPSPQGHMTAVNFIYEGRTLVQNASFEQNNVLDNTVVTEQQTFVGGKW